MELNKKQKNGIHKLEDYLTTFADAYIGRFVSEREYGFRKEGKRFSNRDIYDDKYRKTVKSEIDSAAFHWQKFILSDFTEEDRNDVNFRTEVMKRVINRASRHSIKIIFDVEALAEAIVYCPEGIKEWYHEDYWDSLISLKETKEIKLSPELIEKIAKEHPEVIGKLPPDILPKDVKKQIKPNDVAKKVLEEGVTTEMSAEARRLESDLCKTKDDTKDVSTTNYEGEEIDD